MRTRHRDQHNLVIVPFRIGVVRIFRMFAKREQVAVGQHRTLGVARGARSVELQNRIVWPCGIECKPSLRLNHRACFGLADNAPDIRELPGQCIARAVKAKAGEQYLRSGIL